MAILKQREYGARIAPRPQAAVEFDPQAPTGLETGAIVPK
jgi:hypothetical protein